MDKWEKVVILAEIEIISKNNMYCIKLIYFFHMIIREQSIVLYKQK